MSAVEATGKLLVNKRELAKRILQCSLPTLNDLMERYPDFPVEERGSNGREYLFDAERVVEFLREQREGAARDAQTRADLFKQFTLPIDDVAPAEALGMSPAQRAQLAKARLVENKLAREAGLLVSTPELRQVLTSALGRLGKFLEQLPAQLAREHGLPDEFARAMRTRIDEQRRVFVRDLRIILEDDNGVRG